MRRLLLLLAIVMLLVCATTTMITANPTTPMTQVFQHDSIMMTVEQQAFAPPDVVSFSGIQTVMTQVQSISPPATVASISGIILDAVTVSAPVLGSQSSDITTTLQMKDMMMVTTQTLTWMPFMQVNQIKTPIVDAEISFSHPDVVATSPPSLHSFAEMVTSSTYTTDGSQFALVRTIKHYEVTNDVASKDVAGSANSLIRMKFNAEIPCPFST